MRVDSERETRLDEGADPWVGRTLGERYRIESVLGRGGMGVVYKATQLSLGRPVAVKVLPEGFAERPQFLARFHREVDVLSRLSHPNIVTVLERGEADGRPYLVMEYVDGTSLREVIKQGPLPPSEALAVVRGVLSALEHAHARGIIHRDIKPENVLVAPGGIVKVADFGLGRLLGTDLGTRLTHTHLLLGTFEYMAPEQREKAKEADERADIYATGVVLYEMIAGELPIGAFEPLSAKRPGECDSRIDRLVKRSLEKSPEKRYQHAAEMGGDVSRLLTSAPEPEPEKPATPETGVDGFYRKRRRHGEHRGAQWLFWLALVFGIPAVGLGLWVGADVPETAASGRHEIAVARVECAQPLEFARNVLEDVEVQRFLRERLGSTVWSRFPAGLAWRERDGRLTLLIPIDRCRGGSSAQELAATIGMLMEKAAPGVARRIVTGEPEFERKLESMRVEAPVATRALEGE